MEDFTPYVYPQTIYNAPLAFESHADFLRGGTLRHAINTEMHYLGLIELEMVLELVKMARKTATEIKGDR